MNALQADLLAITRQLDRMSVPYAMMGGMAVAVWGKIRYTSDVDLIVDVRDEHVEVFIRRLEPDFPSVRPDPVEFARRTHVARVRGPGGTPIDLLFARYPLQTNALQHRVAIETQGHSVQVVSAEDLILHKIISDRSKDQEDVTEILFTSFNRINMDRIEKELKALCDAYQEYALLELWNRMKREVEATLAKSAED